MPVFCCDHFKRTGSHALMCGGPLAEWEKELLHSRPHMEGEGNVIFKRTDGKSVTVQDVRIDSIGADKNGVVSMEFFHNDRVIHLPFIESWEVAYRV